MKNTGHPEKRGERLRHVSYSVDAALLPVFFHLLQKGVVIEAEVGCSVMSLLREQLQLSDAAIARIQSVILNGGPVDDLESTLVRDGDTLALSAAMPGLVGATLRRGGAYSGFRSAITHRESGDSPSARQGTLRLKVFNLLMAEIGPLILLRGVIITLPDLVGVVESGGAHFLKGCRSLLLDGMPKTPGSGADLSGLVLDADVLLTVRAV